MIYPMLACSGKEPFDSPDWIFELKWDGFRCLTIIQDEKVYLRSKQGNSLNSRFSALIKKLQEKITFNCILDGELVVLNPDGYSCFESLICNTHNPKVVYQVFDLIQYKDQPLANKPLIERKEILKKILPINTFMRYVDHIEISGVDFFQLIRHKCLEGIMAKKKDGIYCPGERSKQWLKIKNKEYSDRYNMNQRFKKLEQK